MRNGKYTCNTKDCKIPFLKSNSLNESKEWEKDDKVIGKSFSHSFRYSSNVGNNDKSYTTDTAQSYLKGVIKEQTKMTDFIDFYNGTYNGPGIVNSYLRLLDVYSELSIEKQEFLHPNQKYRRIKIFETDILEEFEKERETGFTSDALDEELQDLIDHHLLIIPIFVSLYYN